MRNRGRLYVVSGGLLYAWTLDRDANRALNAQNVWKLTTSSIALVPLPLDTNPARQILIHIPILDPSWLLAM
jgi:hypothetical protein